MKKIFFIFTMLLMSITSVLAEELSVQIDTSDADEYVLSFSNGPFTVEGEVVDYWGLWINSGCRIAISSKNGEKITKVKFRYGYGEGEAMTDDGHLEGTTIYDVNKSYLEIYSDVYGENNWLEIDQIIIYYESEMDEYMQTESFSISDALKYLGSNIAITGTEGDNEGLHIANGNSVTISSTEGMQIEKVTLGFSAYDKVSPIESTNGVVDGWSIDNWTINNVHSSSLTITTPGESRTQINYIKVYYMEIAGKDTEIFDVAGEYSYSGRNVTVMGTCADSDYGWKIANGESVTVTSNNSDIEIERVDLEFSVYENEDPINSTAGIVNGYSIHNDNSSSLTITNPGRGNVWVNKITVHYRMRVAPSTIDVAANLANGAYWTTFYSNASNYKAPEGTEVFKVNLDGTKITMTKIKDRIVTKGQGVVLKSTTGDIVMDKADSSSSDDYSGNSLRGTSVTIKNPGNAYVLNYKKDTGVGFYKLSSNGTIAMNKAYLVYGDAAAHAYFAFDAVVTGIEMNKADGNEDDDKIYDLMGRRIAKPTNGIYIVNGKKVIMNKR